MERTILGQDTGHIPVSSVKPFRGPDHSKAGLGPKLCTVSSANTILSVVGFGAMKRANNKKDSVLKLQEKDSNLGVFWVVVAP